MKHIPKDMLALLPVENLATRFERDCREADLRASRCVWIVVAVAGWGFVILLSTLAR